MGTQKTKIDLMHELFGISNNHCKDCSNLTKYTQSKTWYKCKVYGDSRCSSTDWAKSWEACGLFCKSIPVHNISIIDRIKHRSKRASIHQDANQLELPFCVNS